MAPSSKGKREPVRFSVTLYPEDDPDLYIWCVALPKGKQRRRALILSRLRTGLVEADSFGSTASPSGSKTAPVQKISSDSAQLRPTESTQGSQTAPVQQSSADPEQLHPTEDMEIPLEDLNEIFGAPSFANT